MKPISPVIPGFEKYERVYGADQPEYIPLPTLPTGGEAGVVISRWRMTWRERLRVLFFGDVYVRQMTFGHALQPVVVHVDAPVVEAVSAQAEPISGESPLPEFPANEVTRGTSMAEKRILRPSGGDVLRFGHQGSAAPSSENLNQFKAVDGPVRGERRS